MNKTYSITLIALGAALIVALSPFQIALGHLFLSPFKHW